MPLLWDPCLVFHLYYPASVLKREQGPGYHGDITFPTRCLPTQLLPPVVNTNSACFVSKWFPGCEAGLPEGPCSALRGLCVELQSVCSWGLWAGDLVPRQLTQPISLPQS